MNIRLCGDAILFDSGWNDGQRSWMNISSSLRAVVSLVTSETSLVQKVVWALVWFMNMYKFAC